MPAQDRRLPKFKDLPNRVPPTPPMSAFGTKRTSQPWRTMSPFGSKADIAIL
jgi:hypothetical protein